uniref:Uncharacterized protein n=1 Tax=Musa acuminata subsp. malaccensis TaxID=214687 RepID=A0A804J733_MUSAM
MLYRARNADTASFTRSPHGEASHLDFQVLRSF